jgi:hypothetical protein
MQQPALNLYELEAFAFLYTSSDHFAGDVPKSVRDADNATMDRTWTGCVCLSVPVPRAGRSIY